MTLTTKERRGSSTKILQFGEVLYTNSGLTFFQAKLSPDNDNQIAVVLDQVILGSIENDISKKITSYVDFVNYHAEINNKIAKISEVGITPDLKPFLVTDLDSITPVEDLQFENEEKLMLYFKEVYSVLFNILQKSDYKIDLGNYTLFGESGQIAFPGIYSLSRKLSDGTDISGNNLLNDVTEYCLEVIESHNNNKLFKNPTTGSLTLGKSKEETRRKVKFCLSTGNSLDRSAIVKAFSKLSPRNRETIYLGFYFLNSKFKILLSIYKNLKTNLKFLKPKLMPIIACITGFGLIIFLSTRDSTTENNLVQNDITASVVNDPVTSEVKHELVQDIPRLSDEDELKRLKEVDLIKSEHDKKILIDLMHSSDFETKINALKLIPDKVARSDKAILSTLHELLLDSDYLVRGFSVTSLAAYDPEGSKQVLEEHQKTENSEVVKSAIDRALLKVNSRK